MQTLSDINTAPPPPICKREDILYLRQEELYPHPDNPRGPLTPSDVEDLVRDLRATGRILQPLTVTADGRIVIGHRRFLAGCIAGLGEFPCTVRDMTEEEQLRTMMSENLHRRDLNPIQEARGYLRLTEIHGSAAQVARTLGLESGRVTSMLRLLELSDAIQEHFAKGRLPLAAGAELLKIEDLGLRSEIADHAARTEITLKGLKCLIKAKTKPRKRRAAREDERLPDPSHMLRTEVVEMLDGSRTATVNIGQILGAVDRVMCLCSDAETPEEERDLCQQCPFSRLLNKIYQATQTR